MRVLLDTAALILAADAPDRLSKPAFTVLRNPENTRELSAISLSEIAIKATLGKLDFPSERAHQALDDLDVRILPFTSEHAFQLFELPIHHRDPFDRQIIAQALCEEIPVVTPDESFRRYAGLKVIW